MNVDQVGIGIYSLAQAARLIHADRRSVDRWMFGYDHKRSNEDGSALVVHSDALWRPQHSTRIAGEKVIGFRDLLELRIVKEFVQHGVPLLVIRRCLDTAKQIYGMGNYPFSTQRFCTDGKTIFQEVVKEGCEPEILDLRSRQYALRDIIKPSLYAGIEYDNDIARRWFPQGKQRTIVIDPAIQFGKPILADAGVPTDTLYAAYLAEDKDIQAVSRMYEVTPKQVDAAVKFELRLAA